MSRHACRASAIPLDFTHCCPSPIAGVFVLVILLCLPLVCVGAGGADQGAVFTGDHASAPVPAPASAPGQVAQESAGAGEAGEGPRPSDDHGACLWLCSAGSTAGAVDLWVFAVVRIRRCRRESQDVLLPRSPSACCCRKEQYPHWGWVVTGYSLVLGALHSPVPCH